MQPHAAGEPANECLNELCVVCSHLARAAVEGHVCDDEETSCTFIPGISRSMTRVCPSFYSSLPAYGLYA
jgi:hypothetical protein